MIKIFFSLQDGSRGHLEGLASVYCELLMAPFTEVLAAIESARLDAWAERSPRHVTVHRGHRGGQHGGLPNSFSQPIYVPGKYLVSLLTIFLICRGLFLLSLDFTHALQ